MEEDELRSEFSCLTFTTTDKSAETAARVAATSSHLDNSDTDFEFDLVVQADVSLDEVFPIFSHEHLSIAGDVASAATSSDDGDELEGVATSLYCVWRPRKVEVYSPGQVKKRGSGWKLLKLLDFLGRSNSDGKGDFVFLAPKVRGSKGGFVFSGPNNRDFVNSKPDDKGDFVILGPKNRDVVKSKAKGTAIEEFYSHNRDSKEGQKRKLYLPYKKNLLGFLANMKGIGRP